jgi:proteasome lid subunit RPN8/RPN11
MVRAACPHATRWAPISQGWNPAGIYHSGDLHDPQPLWANIRETQRQSRLWAIQNGIHPPPPELSSQLPDALRTEAG